MFRRLLPLSFLFVFFLPTNAAAAIGCCIVLQNGKTAATSQADVSSCFAMLTIGDCDAYKNNNGVATAWRNGACSTLDMCGSRAPKNCCKTIANDQTTKCIPTADTSSCNIFIQSSKAAITKQGQDPYSFRSKQVDGSCAAQPDCAGKIYDEAIYNNRGSVSLSTAPDYVPVFVAPKLAVNIPGVNFSQLHVSESGGKKYVDIPYLAQYIKGIYTYVLGAVALLAIAMIIWGGIKWVSAAGNTEMVSSAKTNITNAVIGLILAFGSYVILSTINPDLINLKSLQIALVERQLVDVTSYLSGGKDAQSTLREVGIMPLPNLQPSKLTIPRDSCPGRTSGKNRLCCRSTGKCLDDTIIDQYLAEQARTGVPAATLMAQIANEAGTCAVINLFSGQPSNIHYNYGGIGCTARDVPAGGCPHTGFMHGVPTNKVEWTASLPFDYHSNVEINNLSCRVFNSYSEACVNACEGGPNADFASVCGPKCYPQKSHASAIVQGKEVWIPSYQCSRKFANAQEFLDSHLGFVKPCLPYNNSAYLFAYCIGASSYAGVSGSKGKILADIIADNCLCDPATDATGCIRNTELETKLANNIIKKRNLFLDYKGGQPDYATIVNGLAQATQGLLTPAHLPQDDLTPIAPDPE